MYRILVVEDDKEQLSALCHILENYNENFVIQTADNYHSALALITTIKFDLFFLDLKLEETWNTAEDGLQLGIKIRSIPTYLYTPIVYITSVPEMIQQALSDTSCFRYILKPYTALDIENCLNLLLHSPLVAPPTFTFTNYWGGTLRILENDILYFSPYINHRLYIVTANGTYETLDYTMEQLEHALRHSFFRCHRKYLININKITTYDRTHHTIYLDTQPIPLGRSHKTKFEELWRMHICF